MALTPQTNEAFLREVDEQVRLDTAARFWKRWGAAVIVAIGAALIAFGGYLWWQNHRNAVAGVDGEKLSMALDDLSENRPQKAEADLKTLTTSNSPGYRATAKLALAASLLAKNDVKGAVAAYAAIAADTSLDQSFRDVALIRQTASEFDTLKPQQVIDRLKPLAIEGKPWFGSAGEMTAIAYMKMNNNREAGMLFAAMAKDEGVPETIRSRSVQLASVLGVDVTPAGDKGRK